MFARLPALNSLRAFEAAARLGSFQAAARELHVTPTAISHQVRGLEEKLGVRLFHRDSRRVTLTDQGRRLALAAREALRGIATAMEDIGAARSVLTVSTTAAFAALWLVPRLAAFRAGQPNLDVRIHTSEEPADPDRNGSIDAAIRYLPLERVGAAHRQLAQETFGVYINPARRGRRRRVRTLLGRIRLIDTRWRNEGLPALGWRQWLARFAPDATGPPIDSFDQEHHAVQAAMAGDGMVLASSVLVQTAIANGWLVPLEPECRLPGFAYCWVTARRDESTKVRTFGSWLAAELAG